MRSKLRFLKKAKIKKIIANLFLSFVTFLIFLGILEIILRTTHLLNARISWVEPDFILGKRFTPGRKYWSNNENDHPITGRINRYGWRDKNWSLQKPNNTYRIAVLGDSFVEAFQVESDRTFLAITECQLEKRNNFKAELMNFGHSGFTQTEELLVLENEVTQFSPDVVVLFFYPLNDIADVSRETASEIMRPFFYLSKRDALMLDKNFTQMREFKLRCFINWIKQRSALISFFCERYNSYSTQKRTRTKNALNIKRKGALQERLEGYLGLCTNNPNPTYLKNYKLNKILIKAIAEHCKEKKIRFMLVTINTKAYIPKVDKQYKLIDPTFDSNFFEDDLENFAKSLNINYLGLQRIFKRTFETKSDSLHWGHWNYDWGHWNYEGHEVVASALTKKLKSIIYSNEQGKGQNE